MHTRCSETRDALEALITRLHRIQDLPPFCGSNHDAFNRAPPGTALTPEGGQGGREGTKQGPSRKPGGSSGQGHPLKRHFASFTSSFLLFHSPPSPSNHTRNPQPATRNPTTYLREGLESTLWFIPPTSTTSNSHRLTSRAITPGVARSRPSRSLHFFLLVSLPFAPLCSVQGCDSKVLQDGSSVSPARPSALRPPPSTLPAAPCPSTSTFVRVCASRCRKRPSRIDSQHISRGLIVLCVGV